MHDYNQSHKINYTRAALGILSVGLLILASVWISQVALAQPAPPGSGDVSPLHPVFALLDSQGVNALESGKPVSTMQTCGQCHDTEFIVAHSFHADVGLQDYTSPGQVPEGRPWDTSPGYFGKWNPFTYRYLSPEGDELVDLGTATWLQTLGVRHVGGGPAQTSRDGQPLTDLSQQTGDPETHVVDPLTGELVPWDWQASGVVEMNCFLCHTPEPNNQERLDALHNGQFGWANTATLVGSGIIEKFNDEYRFNSEAFTDDGKLAADFVNIQDPGNENCGLCHGLVHDNLLEPLVSPGCSPEIWSTVTTGQIISPQRLNESGMNLANKPELDRTWDVHAERRVDCTDCHFSLNNPVYYQESQASRPDHLTFDPRRLELGEYLYQPIHQFARGQSAQGIVAPELKDTMRRCESCHSIENTHDWLPYKEQHTLAMSCESCHIPKLFSSANQQRDWTVITLDSQPATACRGVESATGGSEMLVTGYQPVLLPRAEVDGDTRLAPHNLITSWYWIYGDPPRPVRLIDLQAAYLDGENYRADVLGSFDQNGDGELDDQELRIDTPEKQELITNNLLALGLENPRITSEIQPYSINHDIATAEWAVRDCSECHGKNSRITQPMKLTNNIPGGVIPEFVKGSNVITNGEIAETEQGELYYQPVTMDETSGLYILGHDSVFWIDLIGSLAFLGVLLAISAHAGLRFLAALRKPQESPELKQVYMYTAYARFWHWLQTFTIILLLFTGLIIHRPDTFGIFSFRYVVLVHNILAAILLINAALSLFYHLASGEIRQYIPRPQGFIDQAIAQALFYVRGIFRNEHHPFEKTPEKKLNPLQQITYFAILNLLLPLQVLTGILMWGAQRWPNLAQNLGGLPFLAPFHTLIAWLFASFIVAHVYLTTTAHAPFASIKAMMVGWDEVEVIPSTTEDTGRVSEEVPA